jgi:hypothetical protein
MILQWAMDPERIDLVRAYEDDAANLRAELAAAPDGDDPEPAR